MYESYFINYMHFRKGFLTVRNQIALYIKSITWQTQCDA